MVLLSGTYRGYSFRPKSVPAPCSSSSSASSSSSPRSPCVQVLSHAAKLPMIFYPALTVLLTAGLLPNPARADIDNLFPVEYITNPIASHVAFAVPAMTPTVCTLAGHEDDSKPLQYMIKSLPAMGKLYETSQNYRSYGTDPKNAPRPIEEFQLPFLVSDAVHRVVYVPPANVFPPEGRWSSFTYVVKDAVEGKSSADGYVVLNNPSNYIGSSTFVSDNDDWSISGNINDAAPVHQPYGWGAVNRYIYGTDEVQYVDFTTGHDKSKWYFVAPVGKFYVPEMATAYGGKLRFTIKATYGDFNYLNSPLDWVTLECQQCNNGRGLRIVRFTDQLLNWNGEERAIEMTLKAGNSWQKDPLNQALPFTEATECEIAAVLWGLTKLKILGDFTQAGEGVAIDDIAVESAADQPAFPVQCQKGCVCKHYPVDRRLECCGNPQD